MSPISGVHSPFAYVIIISVLYFLHQSCTDLEADLVSSSHLGDGGIAYAVKYLVEHINLLLAQRIFKRYAELVKLVRELSGVNIAHTEVINHINHRYMSFQIQYYRKRLH